MISSSSLHLCVFSNVSTAKAYSSYWKKLLKLKLPDCSLLPCTVRPPRSDVLGSPLFPGPPLTVSTLCTDQAERLGPRERKPDGPGKSKARGAPAGVRWKTCVTVSSPTKEESPKASARVSVTLLTRAFWVLDSLPLALLFLIRTWTVAPIPPLLACSVLAGCALPLNKP